MGRLRDLSVDEISLVDSPANAETDPVTGRRIPRAVVAFWKRDNDEQVTRTGERRPMKQSFTEVLKSAGTRDAVCVAVEKEAEAISKRDGISMERARVRAWTDEAMEKYERLPLPVVKRAERRMGNFTKAEAELEDRARKRMRKTGCSYAKAVSQELEDDPSLYSDYEKQKAAGETFEAPQPVEYIQVPTSFPSDGGNSRYLNKRGKKKLAPGYEDARDDDDDEDDEDDDAMADLELRDRTFSEVAGQAVKKCRNCQKGVMKGHAYCGHCGTRN